MFTVKFFYKLKKKNLTIMCNEVHSLSLDLKKVREERNSTFLDLPSWPQWVTQWQTVQK